MKETKFFKVFMWLLVLGVSWTLVIPEGTVMASEQKHSFRGSVAPKPGKPSEEKKKASAAKSSSKSGKKKADKAPQKAPKAPSKAGKTVQKTSKTPKQEPKASKNRKKDAKAAQTPKASQKNARTVQKAPRTSQKDAKTAQKNSETSKKDHKAVQKSTNGSKQKSKAAKTPQKNTQSVQKSSKVSKKDTQTAQKPKAARQEPKAAKTPGKDSKTKASKAAQKNTKTVQKANPAGSGNSQKTRTLKGSKTAAAGRKVSQADAKGIAGKVDRKALKKPVTTQRLKKKKASAAKIHSKKTNKDLHLNVKAAFLVNMSNGKIYYEQNPDTPIAPASITKVLTLYLVREAMAQGKITPATAIPISDRAIRTGGSRMSLKRGEKVPLRELIKGISVVSANNACVAVAEYMGKGDSSRFVSRMNAKAKKIGMSSSRFKNPNGLPAHGQLSTARDIAKLSMSYLRRFPESLSIHSMTTHTYHGATHRNANSLLRTYKGADGLKTGFVCASGYNITATAKRGNTRLLAVVLGAQNSVSRQVETARLLDYGFKRATMEKGLGNGGKKPKPKSKAQKNKKNS